jgi:epoxyqueuosine reductase
MLADPTTLRRALEDLAHEQGFSRVGVARAGIPPRFELFEDWIGRRLHAQQAYLDRSLPLRRDPALLLPGVRSIIVLAHPHPDGDPAASDGARTARYALSEDYHRVLRKKCRTILERLRREGFRFASRVCVDSAPVNERAWAALAGIGWIGKNGMVMNETDGSYFWLCEILTDARLASDAPVAERCGSCVRCLQACPTQALLAPGLLDSERCLSYWTIEQRGVIPEDMADRLNGWLFGCDICQEVCPYNGPAPAREASRNPPALADLLSTGSASWKRRFADTALSRAGLSGMRRNAAALAESSGRRDLLPQLRRLARSGHAVASAQARRTEAKLQGRMP